MINRKGRENDLMKRLVNLLRTNLILQPVAQKKLYQLVAIVGKMA